MVEEFRGSVGREEQQPTTKKNCNETPKLKDGIKSCEVGGNAGTKVSGDWLSSPSSFWASRTHPIDVDAVVIILERQLFGLPDAIREALTLGDGYILEMCLNENVTLDFKKIGGVVNVILATEEYNFPIEVQQYLLTSYPAALFSCLVDGNFDPHRFLTLMEVLLYNQKAGFFLQK